MRIKSFTEILGRMIDLTLINSGEINDFSQSSTIFTIYQAIAMELELIGMLNRENVLQGIETGIFEAFDFPRRESRKAYGEVTLIFSSEVFREVRVPQGTIFFSSRSGYNQEYEVIEDYVVPAGASSAIVEVFCTEPGTIGNVPSEVINSISANIFNITEVYNSKDFLTGRDRESLEDVKRRFREYIHSRGRATKKSIEYAAFKVPDVTGAHVVEEVGRVRLFVHDGDGNLPRQMREDVITMTEDYRPSGIKLDVFPITKREIDMYVTVTLADDVRNNREFKELVRVRIRSHINQKQAANDLVLMELKREIMNMDEYSIYDVEINNHVTNIKVGSEELLRAGDVRVDFEVRGEVADGEEE